MTVLLAFGGLLFSNHHLVFHDTHINTPGFICLHAETLNRDRETDLMIIRATCWKLASPNSCATEQDIKWEYLLPTCDPSPSSSSQLNSRLTAPRSVELHNGKFVFVDERLERVLHQNRHLHVQI